MDGDDGSRDDGGGGDQSADEEDRLQAKLDEGAISESEYARLTALRFGENPEELTFADAAALYGLTEDELREEIEWLSREG